ncbi:MAG TPA: aspartate aminotransferase family protein [Blastocatellia bacterium]|jgi:4-aminobutyrate aminotransferase|nr:aspartate aminotransferase family protein [Blastocatellia bacterium]
MTAPDVTEKSSTADLIAKQKEFIWSCAATYYAEPLALERGEGMYVWDSEGNRYLDCFGGVLTTSVGHARPEIVEAVSAQVARITHTSTLYINRPQAELAAKIAEITPGNLKKSFFTNSGTEADETAMVLARIYTGRSEIIALRHAYHGRSVMNMTATGHSTWKLGGSFMPGIVHAHAPYCYRCPFNLKPESCAMECARDVEELIQTSTSGQVAAFIAEPIMGVGGFITPPKDYFKVVTEIIRRYGGIFICDEVQTGWGRTGDVWCGIEHWEVEPEVMTFAKGMANGAPIGCTTAVTEVADKYPGLTFSTFGGNPLTSVAALATIRVIEENDLPRNARVVGDYLRAGLEELKDKYSVIGDVRGMGLMQAIECVKDRGTKQPDPQSVLRVFEETRKRGVLIGKGGLYGNIIRLGPPLVASKSDIDELIAALDGAFASL